ncbi:MAG: TRAM domain-containing protein [Acidimicrobiales bacterium]
MAVERIAKGGDGVGVGPDGRVVFVASGVPGDRVEVRITLDKKRFRRGEIVSIVEPSPDRVEPPCPHVAEGCGGCDWQHIAIGAQHDLRLRIVTDALERIGKLPSPPVIAGAPLESERYRTTIRAAVSGDRAGYRAAQSHRVVVPNHCLIAHPLAEEILVQGRFPGAEEVTIKVGGNTGERLVIVSPSATGCTVPDGVQLIGRDELLDGATTAITDIVDGVRLRISADSFFQSRTDGAEALVAAAAEMIANAEDGPLVDAYCGGGLFGALLGGERHVTGVESNRSSLDDARVNLGPDAEVHDSLVEQWWPSPATVVIADPARAGLGKPAVDVLAATGATTLVLVSCDPASLGRDAALLIDAGFLLRDVRVFDLFGHTSHIETVAHFER